MLPWSEPARSARNARRVRYLYHTSEGKRHGRLDIFHADGQRLATGPAIRPEHRLPAAERGRADRPAANPDADPAYPGTSSGSNTGTNGGAHTSHGGTGCRAKETHAICSQRRLEQVGAIDGPSINPSSSVKPERVSAGRSTDARPCSGRRSQ